MTDRHSVIVSMTGFGAAAREHPHGTLGLEIRSVNSRFLDLGFRMGDEMRAVEPALREALTAAVTRGKVEVRVGYARDGAARPGRTLAVNRDTVASLMAAQADVLQIAPDARRLGVKDILGWPGVIEDAGLAPDALRAEVLALAAEALAEFRASRSREGEKLKAMLLERVAGIRGWVAKIEPLLPQLVADQHARLVTRLREALGSADDERIRQEVAMFGIRIDVAEELSRLAAHLGEVERVLAKGGACGKRLDFLMQELHREANTLGSKSVSTDVSASAMEIKILIEQMREQVQNIE
jgi:uncharacterized protein (TIGR00255 family)